MKPFWRTEPLSESESEILRLLSAAHDESARRENVSHVALVNTFLGSGSYANAIAAAILTLGGRHGPIEETMRMLESHTSVVAALDNGVDLLVPGWGNSFVKGRLDPLWEKTDTALRKARPDLMSRADAITDALHRRGKDVWPNPSYYTAAVAIALKMPPQIAGYLFITARLEAWTEIALCHAK